MKDSPYCFLHRPEPEARQRALVAQHRGGQANVIVVGEGVRDIGWPKQVHLKRPRDVRRFVSRVMNEVRAGKVEPGLANSLFVGANVLLKSFDCEAIERLEALERAARERGLIGEITP
jgi:hypothetical protein